MRRESTCLLCGDTSRDVGPNWVVWAKDFPSQSSSALIDRCSKTHECYERVLRDGNEWIAREPIDGPAIRERVGDPLPMPEVRHA